MPRSPQRKAAPRSATSFSIAYASSPKRPVRSRALGHRAGGDQIRVSPSRHCPAHWEMDMCRPRVNQFSGETEPPKSAVETIGSLAGSRRGARASPLGCRGAFDALLFPEPHRYRRCRVNPVVMVVEGLVALRRLGAPARTIRLEEDSARLAEQTRRGYRRRRARQPLGRGVVPPDPISLHRRRHPRARICSNPWPMPWCLSLSRMEDKVTTGPTGLHTQQVARFSLSVRAAYLACYTVVA